MLRLLHTGDWHLGHVLHGFDRAREHALVLDWLGGVLREERVDALLVAGDVFDGANPPVEAQRAWYRFLVEAWAGDPHLQVVVIGGNHDSAARLDCTGPLLHAMRRLHVLGGVAREGGEVQLERHLVPLHDASGAVAAWVAAVPHLRAADTGGGDDAQVAAGTRAFYARVLDLARARRAPGQALLALGHLHLVDGQVSALSERRLTVGGQGAVSADLFPADVAYAALGHLHLPQQVGGREGVRYAGSLLPLSLAERDYPHQVLVVELEGERLQSVRPLRAPRVAELPRIPPVGSADVEEALAAVRALPERGDGPEEARPLLEVEVRLARAEPALRQRVEEALRDKEARLARLGVTYTGTGQALAEADPRALTDLTPEEVLRRRWERDHEDALPEEVLAAFHELLALGAEAAA